MYVHTQTSLCSMYVCRSRTYVCVNMCIYVDLMFTHVCMEVLLTHSLVLQRVLANTSVCLMLFVCTWMRACVCLRAPKYAYTRMYCMEPACAYLCLNVFVYTCMQTSIYICKLTNMHACIHACIGRCTYTYTHDASLSLRVPAQASRLQSADDAA